MAGGQDGRKPNYFEGWLEHKGGGGKETYNNLYIVLRKRKLYIYPHNDLDSSTTFLKYGPLMILYCASLTAQFLLHQATKSKMPIGSLTLDRFTTAKRKDKGGFKLELSTISAQPTDATAMTFKHNTFKSPTKADRDLWYAFIVSISQGQVPSSVPINPMNRALIEEAIQDCVRPRSLLRSNTEPILPPKTDLPSPSGWPDRQAPPPPGAGGRQRKNSTPCDILSRPLPIVPPSSRHFSSISSGSDDSRRSISNNRPFSDSGAPSFDEAGMDGPYTYHKFYMNRANCHNIPTWFFENCTRDTAEMALMLGKRYGNVLMRESTTYRQSGSYVIDVREESPRGTSIRHFEVIRVAEGFKIDLLDHEHEPMCCLTEVMNFITQCIGPDFRPMSTNDRNLIGLPVPEYDRVLNSSFQSGSRLHEEEDLYTVPDTAHREDEYASPVDYEQEYMDMRTLKQDRGKSSSISRPRPRPKGQQQQQQQPHPQQQTYDVPGIKMNNPFLNEVTPEGNPRDNVLSTSPKPLEVAEGKKYDPHKDEKSLEKIFV